MKIKFLQLIAAFVATSFVATSCLGTNEVKIEYGAESSITSFSVGTLNITRVGKDMNGNDSIYNDTINCSKYPFTIDQINRTIENKDSLPVGTDATKVPLSIEADTYYVLYEKLSDGEFKDTLWTSADSLDFTKPYKGHADDMGVRFKVMAPDGVMGNPYTVKVNVHKQVPDKLIWNSLSASFAGGAISNQKAIYHNKRIYVFGNQNGKCVMTSITAENGRIGSWSSPIALDGTDPISATLWNEQFYILKGNELCKIKEDGTLEPVTTNLQLKALISGAYTGKLYAVDINNKFIASADGMQWNTEEGEVLIPSSRIYSFTHTYEHNTNITGVTFIGNNLETSANDSTAIVYGRLTDEKEWTPYEQGINGCPNFENMAVVNYDDRLLAFGGNVIKGGKETIAPFSAFYQSIDNGNTWQCVTSALAFPKENAEKGIKTFATKYTDSHKNYSCVTGEKDKSNNFIWIIWEDGSIERGLINRLHFQSKW